MSDPVADALRRQAEAAKALIASLHDDDIWCPTFLEQTVPLLADDPTLPEEWRRFDVRKHWNFARPFTEVAQAAALAKGEPVAIDRTSKFAYAELHRGSDRLVAIAFLQALIKAVPYTIHTILTDNGSQFCHAPRYRTGPTARLSPHLFDRLCRNHSIDHRLTKPNHPWTNGQVERMNRTLKDATVRRHHYHSHDELKQHLHPFLMAYNFAKRLKTLRGLTLYEYVCRIWKGEPQRFHINPAHHTVGLNR